MLYCPICGISYQAGDVVCVKCGNKLTRELGQENETAPVTGGNAVFNRAFMKESGDLGMGVGQDIETQLGKGLIKPNSIELEIDGFHFKYDQPVRNFAKTENFKEKLVEFRLNCADTPPAGTAPDKTAAAEGLSEETAPVETVISEASQEALPLDESQSSVESEIKAGTEVAEAVPMVQPAEAETADTMLDTGTEPPEKEIWTAGELLPETVADSPPATGSMPVMNLPEPELETEEDVEILWEDWQRWLGIPFANQYRISNRSLQISDRLARKFSEVDLTLISKVTLRQSWLDKLFKTGDLVISVKYLPEPGLKLTGVRHPEKVRSLLEELRKSNS